jgi:hypothetical protein
MIRRGSLIWLRGIDPTDLGIRQLRIRGLSQGDEITPLSSREKYFVMEIEKKKKWRSSLHFSGVESYRFAPSCQLLKGSIRCHVFLTLSLREPCPFVVLPEGTLLNFHPSPILYKRTTTPSFWIKKLETTPIVHNIQFFFDRIVVQNPLTTRENFQANLRDLVLTLRPIYNPLFSSKFFYNNVLLETLFISCKCQSYLILITYNELLVL